jgi:hypothetical protein
MVLGRNPTYGRLYVLLASVNILQIFLLFSFWEECIT